MANRWPSHGLPQAEEDEEQEAQVYPNPNMVQLHEHPKRMPSTEWPPHRLPQRAEEDDEELEGQAHPYPKMPQFQEHPKRMPKPSTTQRPPRQPPQADEEEDDEKRGPRVNRNPKMVQFHEQPKRRPSTTDTPYGRKPGKEKKSKPYICAIITIILVLFGLTVLILWLIFHPKKPRFTVVSAAIYTLNATTGTIPPPLITTSMQFTIVTRNPNRRTSIYYDHLSATVYYHNQAITPPLALPSLDHEAKCTVIVSPVLGGVAVPVAMDVADGLMGDMHYGVMGLRLMFVGRVRYKAGVFKTWHYGAIIKCDVLVGIKNGQFGEVPLIGDPGCKVDI